MAATAEKRIHLGFYTDAAIASAFKQLASRQDLTQSQLLRRLVRAHIAEQGSTPPPERSASEDPLSGNGARGRG
jgi:Ribbon-helix-helix protein